MIPKTMSLPILLLNLLSMPCYEQGKRREWMRLGSQERKGAKGLFRLTDSCPFRLLLRQAEVTGDPILPPEAAKGLLLLTMSSSSS